MRATQWGANDDRPVPGDYDGDLKTDVAVFRPSTNRWYFFRPDAPGQYIERTVGTNADTPAPTDYDGDGLTDFTMWRPSLGFFSIIKSFDGVRTASPALGSGLSELPVSTSYAPE